MTLMERGARGGPSARNVAAVVSGNALEFYDFLTFAYFAVQIGRTFFPSHDPATSLLATLATFGAGFLTRPLGALVIGRMADRVGRKPAMLLSFGLMGAGMLGIAAMPSFAAIGIAAPVLVIALRMIQGFALGGELGSSTAYLMEAAPRGTARILRVSAVRRPGSGDIRGRRDRGRAGKPPLRGRPRRLGLAPGLPHRWCDPPRRLRFAAEPGGDPSPGGPPRRYRATLGLPANISLGATVASGTAGMIFSMAGGILSDRFGRKPMMIVPWIALLTLAMPCYWLMNTLKTPVVLYGATFLISALASLSATANLVAITESLPRNARAGSLALVYALAISVFGGGAQFFVTWLIRVTGSPMAPAWYMTTAVAIGLVAMMFVKESAPARTELSSPLATVTA